MKLLVNKTPLRRICEIEDITLRQLYEKIDFLHQQVVRFSQDREKKLDRCFRDQNAYFSTDIQTILVNWPVKNRRGTIPLLNMCTVHKFSQFVVASTVDFDPKISPDEIEEFMNACADFDKPRSMRRHARLWAHSEYEDSLIRSQSTALSEDDLAVLGRLKLPGNGSRVRGDAFKYAHTMLVKKLIGSDFKSANFCLDDEAGLAATVCSLNVDLINSGQVNVAEISFQKGLTNDDKQRLANEGRALFEQAVAAEADNIARVREVYPSLTDMQAITLLMLWKNFREHSATDRAELFAQKGVPWPYHKKPEPMKAIRLKTDRGDMGWDDLARFFASATLHPVDAYFNFARRRIAGFERGIPTAANSERIWHAYSYYSPAQVPKMVDILRFYYNYMLTSVEVDKQTPAMRLGLARGKVYARDLIAFA